MRSLNVLLVTYSFPPAGGVGVLRAASLARYLPAEQIRLDVLTTRNASAVGADPLLLEQIPSEVTVHRTLTLDLPFGFKKWIKKLITGSKPRPVAMANTAAPARPSFLKRVIGDLLLPDPQVTWLPILVTAVRRIVRQRKIDLVLITVPPFSSVLLVEKLRKSFPSLAIVVDFRDEWLATTMDLVSFSRSDRARLLAHRAEASAVAHATTVVAVTEAARRAIRARYPQEAEQKFQHIPNGFDCTRLPVATAPRTPSDRILLTYTGTLYGSTDPTSLVEALLTLPAEVKSRFHIRFIGRIEEPRFRQSLLQLGEMVELVDFWPQNQAMALMSESDYALLITHDPLNVSAKFYDYLGAGKPILALVHPEGEVRRLLEQLRAGWWVSSNDIAGIRRFFLDALDCSAALTTSFQPDLAGIGAYERQPIAQRYARLLHSIAASQRSATVPPAEDR